MVGYEAIGDRFNPWRRFRGVMIPDPVLAFDISLGAKVCYGVLARYAGEDGECFPTMQTIGGRIGVSDRQAKTYVAELVRNGFISRARGGRGRPNRYSFLWHPSFDSVDGKDSSRVKGSILPTEESHLRENTDSDYLPTHRQNRDARAATISGGLPDGWKALARLVQDLLQRQPTQSGLGRIVSATPGGNEAEAIEAISEAVNRGYGAGGKHGPCSMSWFVSVVRNYWADRERRALPPVASNAGMDAVVFNRIMDTIELPDALCEPGIPDARPDTTEGTTGAGRALTGHPGGNKQPNTGVNVWPT
jgi:hypothetical protein